MTRAEFSERTKTAVYAAQGERCGICHEPTPRSKGRFDHILSCWDGGTNKPENCKFQCWPCDKLKTYSTKHRRLDGDAGRRAKTKRLSAKHEAFRAREAGERPAPSKPKRKIPSRPFPKRVKR
jgi:hypothetical protein